METPSYIPKAPIPPHEMPPERQTIDVVGEDLASGSINVNRSNREENPVKSLIEDGSIGFFEYILEFEEEHPWIFFIGIALVLFIIMGGIISLFFGNNFGLITNYIPFLNQQNNEIIEEQEKTGPPVEVPATVSTALFGIQNGINLTTEEAYDKLVFKGDFDTLLADDIVLIQDINEALAINIQDELAIIEDADAKLKYLTDYLTYIIFLEEKGADSYIRLNTLISNTKTEGEYYDTKRTESKNHVNDIYTSGGVNELASAIAIYNEYENKYDKSQNELIMSTQVLNSFNVPLQTLQARIAAIRANKDILLLGLKIFPIDQAGLDLMNSGTASDWYKSDQPILNTKKTTSGWRL